jgi:hypothetical protein
MGIDGGNATARTLGALALIGAALSGGQGCTSVKATGSARSGTEQLLLTGTWDRALACVDFSPLAGAPVYLNAAYLPETDKGWLTMSLRRAMAAQGVLLKDDRKDAAVILEAALGAYGTDERDCMVGIPSLSNSSSLLTAPLIGPAAALAASAGSSGNSSAALTRAVHQGAVVKLALFAYDAHSGAEVWQSPVVLKASGYRDRYYFGSGPFRKAPEPEVRDFPDASEP